MTARPVTERGAIGTRTAAAEYLGCSVDTLERYEAEGRIVPRSHGRSKSGRITYLVKDLDDLLESLPEYEPRRRAR